MKKNRNIILKTALFCGILSGLAAVSVLYWCPPHTQNEPRLAGSALMLALSLLIVGGFLYKTVVAAESEAPEASGKDSLTNFYNQRSFWTMLEHEIERSRRQKYSFALLLVNIDNFKAVNDLCGHEAGNGCLVEFSSQLRSSLRKVDIGARFGGDVFVVILPLCDIDQASTVAERALDALRDRPMPLPNGMTIHITASAGIAAYPDHALNGENLFLVAETMLRSAKSAGKDRIIAAGTETDLALLRIAGAKSLFIMEAIRQRQITPFFQPIVSTTDGSILAYEVLTRIVTPEKIHAAAEFIEDAENMGAVGKIDFLLIEHAFRSVRQNGYEGKLFFNLSPRAMTGDFIPALLGLMARYEVLPSQLVIEITEREAVKNIGLVEKTVSSLRQKGFQFAIDDFGSGYSSFQYIKLFQVDFLKLDGEFIRRMDEANGFEKTIVENIVSLAGAFSIKTIAEYVESERILDHVRFAGIDYAQGFYIQKPEPVLKKFATFPELDPACYSSLKDRVQ